MASDKPEALTDQQLDKIQCRSVLQLEIRLATELRATRAERDARTADLGAITKLTLDEDPVQGVRNLITLRAEQDRALQAATDTMDALKAELAEARKQLTTARKVLQRAYADRDAVIRETGLLTEECDALKEKADEELARSHALHGEVVALTAEVAELEAVITQQRFDNGKLVEEVERLTGLLNPYDKSECCNAPVTVEHCCKECGNFMELPDA